MQKHICPILEIQGKPQTPSRCSEPTSHMFQDTRNDLFRIHLARRRPPERRSVFRNFTPLTTDPDLRPHRTASSFSSSSPPADKRIVHSRLVMKKKFLHTRGQVETWNTSRRGTVETEEKQVKGKERKTRQQNDGTKGNEGLQNQRRFALGKQPRRWERKKVIVVCWKTQVGPE